MHPDVGADRIARTAHAALRLLGDISGAVHQRVPLAWKAQFEERIAAIEVYPAATLASRGIRCSEYKKKEQREERREIIAHLSKYLSLSMDVSCLVEDADILDAVVCALAGADFLQEDVLWPKDFQTARHEGWIWSKGPALVPESDKTAQLATTKENSRRR
jgi:hypothetical protein